MSWFKHRHWWLELSYSTIPNGIMRYQECRCGAVRTVEYGPGKDPIIRLTETDSDEGTEHA